jgi:hypothetical protein
VKDHDRQSHDPKSLSAFQRKPKHLENARIRKEISEPSNVQHTGSDMPPNDDRREDAELGSGSIRLFRFAFEKFMERCGAA